MKIACIINGQLRIKDTTHANELNELLKGTDVYIRSYPEYQNTFKFLSFKEKVLKSVPKLPQAGLYQYYTLQDIVRKYKNELLEYDLIFRYRTDLKLKIKNLANHLEENYEFKENTFYAKSDWIFCCKPKLFIELFENVFDIIMEKYINKERFYFPIHWENLIKSLESGYGHIRNHWLNYPQQYFPKDFKSNPDYMIPLIRENLKELNDLNNNNNKDIQVYTKGAERRKKKLLSTEKFIIIYVLRKAPLLHFKMDMHMPIPAIRNKWKI
jgi:hypothetical protein